MTKKEKDGNKPVLPIVIPGDEDEISEPEITVTVEIKQSLIEGLKLIEKFAVQQLEGSDWKQKFADAADVKNLRALARANHVATTGVKQELFDRITAKLF